MELIIIFVVIVWNWNQEGKQHSCRDHDWKIASPIWFVSISCFLKCSFLFPFFFWRPLKSVMLSVCMCQPGSVNLMVATIHLPSFLPSFLPSLRECYHSISLPGTLAELQMGFLLWTVHCSVRDAQYCRRKMGKKGWLSNTGKAFLVFPRTENLIWNKGLSSLNWGWDFSMRRSKSHFSPPPQSVSSCSGGLIWNSDCLILRLKFLVPFFSPSPSAVDMAWRATERTAWWCLCWVCGGCPGPN